MNSPWPPTASPYLTSLIARLPDLAARLPEAGPDAIADETLSALRRLPATLPRAALAAALRRAKAEIALATAYADLTGLWDLAGITGVLSDLAEGALRAATAHLLLAAHAAGHIALPHPAAPAQGSGFTVLALGKLGARELNYSSDIDLVLLHDPAAHPGRDTGPIFARLARDLVSLIAARDAHGYVFRVDLRLRPDPGATPLSVALPGALTYYESQAQTWERAAFIKARPVAGDLALGRRLLEALRPVLWRRHLDFAAMADILDMKRRIDARQPSAGLPPALAGQNLPPALAGQNLPPALAGQETLPALAGHDLKRGRGGIREIEFCAQALQLVWAGRNPALRVPATLPALAALVEAGHLPAPDGAALAAAYPFLRRAEHRLQMIDDRQTHTLPASEAALAAFAAFFGADPADFTATLTAHLTAVRRIFTALFAAAGAEAGTTAAPRWTGTGPPPWEAWLAGRPRALRSERSRALLRETLPDLVAALTRQPDPQALTRFDELLHRLPAGVPFLATLHHNPALIERLAEMLGAAPSLADHLAQVPSALDGLLAPLPIEPPAPALAAILADARGPDDALALAARFVRAAEFQIAAAELALGLDADAAGEARAALADATIRALLPLVLRAHETRHGTVPGGGLAVVALGKAGAREMMAGSDLDLMLIYDHAPEAESSGPRRLPAAQYYARAAQALIAALTVPTRDGPLYAVDMRLRPSGRAGPVAVSLAAFTRYHAAEAWTWERLALTRARVTAGPTALRLAAARAIRAALRAGDPTRIAADTREMRARIARDLPPAGPWDVKLRRGGLMDTEFTVQALQLQASANPRVLHPTLRHAAARLAEAGALPPADAATLIAADRTWRAVQGMLRIMLGRRIPEAPGPPALARLAQAAGAADPAALPAYLDLLAAKVDAIFRRHLGETAP